MFEFDLTSVSLTDTEKAVLQAYDDAEQAITSARPQRAEAGGDVPQPAIWVPRINEVDRVRSDQLAPIHGRLIALGLLHFQLQGQDEGVVYRLTPEGRKALSAVAVAVDDEQPARLSA